MEFSQKFNHPQVIKQCFDLLHIDIPSSKVILVAGTNGKGSTSATLQTLLMAAGKNVGFFSSPHLIDEAERIKFNGEDISKTRLYEIFEIIEKTVKPCNIELSYFEYFTVAAAYYFYFDKQVDFAIFEVGLGGTLDATNGVPHDISIITRLGIEHTDVLGKTIESIGANKLGIVQDHNIVFHTEFPKEILPQIEQIKAERQARFIEAQPLVYRVEKQEKGYPIYILERGGYRLNLLGARAVENTALAVTAFENLIPNALRWLPALSNVVWPGRMERMSYKGREIFLSGDHNPQGIQSLLEILQNFSFNNVCFIIGICKDKDSDEMIRLLNSVKNSHLFVTETPEKTRAIDEYSDFIKSKAEYLSADPFKSLDKAIAEAKQDDLVVVTGSLYLVGLIRGKCRSC